MDRWSVAAVLLSAATLLAVVWQIVRFEVSQAMHGWAVSYRPGLVQEDGQLEVTVTFCPIGPYVVHEVEAHGWGAARVPVVTERARMDCNSEPLVATALWRTDQEGYVGFAWLVPRLTSTKPIRKVLRLRLSDGQWQLWRWHWVWRPQKWRQGKWKAWEPSQSRRSFVPDMWGIPGSR